MSETKNGLDFKTIYPDISYRLNSAMNTIEYATNLRVLNPEDNKYYLVLSYHKYNIGKDMNRWESLILFNKEIYNFYILGRIDTKAVRLDGTTVFELDSNQEDEFDRLAKQLPWWEEYKKKQLKKEKDIKESEEKPNEE